MRRSSRIASFNAGFSDIEASNFILKCTGSCGEMPFENEFISLTDIARYKSDDSTAVIQNWMRNRDDMVEQQT